MKAVMHCSLLLHLLSVPAEGPALIREAARRQCCLEALKVQHPTTVHSTRLNAMAGRVNTTLLKVCHVIHAFTAAAIEVCIRMVALCVKTSLDEVIDIQAHSVSTWEYSP